MLRRLSFLWNQTEALRTQATSWPYFYFQKTLYISVFHRNIESKRSKHEFNFRSHKDKQAFEDKKLSGKELLRLKKEHVWQTDIADSTNCTQTFLLFSYLDFRVNFACYSPASFKIICLTRIWSKFVDLRFYSSQKPPQIRAASATIFHSFWKIDAQSSKIPGGSD